AEGEGEAAPTETQADDFMVLPGESLAKYVLPGESLAKYTHEHEGDEAEVGVEEIDIVETGAEDAVSEVEIEPADGHPAVSLDIDEVPEVMPTGTGAPATVPDLTELYRETEVVVEPDPE